MEVQIFWKNPDCNTTIEVTDQELELLEKCDNIKLIRK